MTNCIVLGAGMVGSVVAFDLARDRDLDVTLADARQESLDRAAAKAARLGLKLRTLRADLSDTQTIRKTIAPFGMVFGALSSRIAFAALRAIIEAGKNFCDIAFMSDDFLELDSLAKDRGVTCVVDCGVAPGMSNMLAGYAAHALPECHEIEIYVGGLPRDRRWPFQYKAGFSPADVIEEYTRPSRLVEHGKVVVREALTEPELLDFPGIGTLEAVNTDGLRSLVTTLTNVPFMKEKTLRYPGHYELMRVFRATGLMEEKAVRVPSPGGGTTEVRPRDLLAALMFPQWTYEEGEEDLTVMRVTARARMSDVGCRMSDVKAERQPSTSGPSAHPTSHIRHPTSLSHPTSPSHPTSHIPHPTSLCWDILDFYDKPTGCTSMSRTTAFPCAIVGRMIARGELTKPGVIPPELLGPMPGVLPRVLKELESRGVRYEAKSGA